MSAMEPRTYPVSDDLCIGCGHLESRHALDVDDSAGEPQPAVKCQRPGCDCTTPVESGGFA